VRLLLALATVSFVLATSAPAEELSGTLKKIKDTGVIRLGHLSESVPFSFVDDTGKPVGYSVDLCSRVASGIQEQLGLQKLEVQWIPVTLETRFKLVRDGTIDLECGISTNTLGRQKEVDFSVMTWVDGGNFVVKAEAPITGLADLAGKRIAVIPTTTTYGVLKEVLAKTYVNAEVIAVGSHMEGLEALNRGTVDAYASDQTVLIGLALSVAQSLRLKLGERQFSYEPYGLMLRKNDADFRVGVNTVLSRLYRSGQIVQIYDRWMGKLGRPAEVLGVMYLLNGLPE
jgi:ABC-type amino acid transport substrate-binding protein